MKVVCFGLRADRATDGITFLKELDEDVGPDEAAWTSHEYERCHFANRLEDLEN